MECILAERRRNGKAQFLIRWLGCAPAHAQPTPRPRLAHASPRASPRACRAPGARLPARHGVCTACSRSTKHEARPPTASCLLVRFDASHDSWELEDNVSEELAAAFRESHGGALAPRKILHQQYEAGELGPEPKRRQRDGESSHPNPRAVNLTLEQST